MKMLLLQLKDTMAVSKISICQGVVKILIMYFL